MKAYDRLCFFLNSAEQGYRPGATFNQASSQPAVHALSQVRIRVELFLRFERVFIQPLHEREVEAGALVEKLGGVEVEVAECGEDEASAGDLNDVREVLAIVGTEAGDETVTVDFCVNKG